MKIRYLVAAIVFVSLALTQYASACDEALKPFRRDCLIQDQYRDLREKLKLKNIDIEEVAEYRALRFIDRASWEKAKYFKTKPYQIYAPSPMTWNTWDNGIRTISETVFKNSRFTKEDISNIHRHLISEEIQDSNTDKKLKPGMYRDGENNVGFCQVIQNPKFPRPEFDATKEKLLSIHQELWERVETYLFKGMTHTQRNALGNEIDVVSHWPLAELKTNIAAAPYCQSAYQKIKAPMYAVRYAHGYTVEANMNLWLALMNKVMAAYEKNEMPLSPIEFAAFMQKWMVTIHPFSDGNGRLSRAIQDLILEKFDLPKAPAGDLTQDAMSSYSDYTEETYKQIEANINRLLACALWHHNGLDSTPDKVLISKKDQQTFGKYNCSAIKDLN